MCRQLYAFAFVSHQSERDGVWYRVHTIRERKTGEPLDARTSDLAPEFARRLADRLCDRLGIVDRGALMCGRIFSRQSGVWS